MRSRATPHCPTTWCGCSPTWPVRSPRMRSPGASRATASRRGSAGWRTPSASTACCTGTHTCSCSGPAGFRCRSSLSNDGGASRRGRACCPLWLVVLLQVLTSWYLAVMVLLADALFAIWLAIWLPAEAGTPEVDGAAVGRRAAARAPRSSGRSRDATRFSSGSMARVRPKRSAVPSRGAISSCRRSTRGWGNGSSHHGSQAPSWIWGEKTLFLGYVTLALGALGLSTMWWPTRAPTRRRRTRATEQLWLGFMSLLSLAALALAFGPSADAVASGSFDWTPFGLLSTVPGVSLFRVPARFVQLAHARRFPSSRRRARPCCTRVSVERDACSRCCSSRSCWANGIWSTSPAARPSRNAFRQSTGSSRESRRAPSSRCRSTSADPSGSPRPITSTTPRPIGIRSSTATRAPSRPAIASGWRRFRHSPAARAPRALRAIGADYRGAAHEAIPRRRRRQGQSRVVQRRVRTGRRQAGPDYLFHVLPPRP